MLVSALDGRGIKVRRRWLPWKPLKRRIDPGWVDLTGGADDPVSFIVLVIGGFVAGIVLAVVLTFALLASEFLLVLGLLVPILALARVFWVLPWIIEATNGDTLLGLEKVRGWRDSEDRIRDIAAAYQRGEDPFLGKRIP
jgi:hypothetical protein